MSIALKIWNWILRRSPSNAAKPNTAIPLSQVPPVQPLAAPYNDATFETYSENQHIQGFGIKVGWEEESTVTPEGRLFRTKNNFALPIGCGHIVQQLKAVEQPDHHVRGIAGVCFYCQQELMKSVSRGEISPFDAERLWLVCSDCGKITVSGQLCCPKHYTAVTNPDGTFAYLGPEDVKEQKRKQMTISVLGRLLDLFLEDEPQKEKTGEGKSDNVTNK